MRAFLAFETSQEVVEALVAAQEELRKTGADLKLVERENLHFTVKFLGEIPDSTVAEIDRRVGGLGLPRMEVEVRGLGAFPDARHPRVVWAGVAPRDFDAVAGSAQRVIDALEGIGQTEERRYHPHITVARVRSPRNAEALTAAIRANSAREFGKSVLASLKLESSTLTPKGPIYRDVREYPLQ